MQRRCSSPAPAASGTAYDCKAAARVRSDNVGMTSSRTVPTGGAGTAGTRTVERFLDAAAAGAGIPTELLAPDVVLDATVPGWRYALSGACAVADEYSSWVADPRGFEELERLPVEGGEVVTYLLTWVERGIPHAAHHCHVLRFDPDGRIARDRFFCGGRWDAGLLAEMAAASDAG